MCDGGQPSEVESCDRACHTFCCDPELTEVPEHEWFCDQCSSKRVQAIPVARALPRPPGYAAYGSQLEHHWNSLWQSQNPNEALTVSVENVTTAYVHATGSAVYNPLLSHQSKPKLQRDHHQHWIQVQSPSYQCVWKWAHQLPLRHCQPQWNIAVLHGCKAHQLYNPAVS